MKSPELGNNVDASDLAKDELGRMARDGRFDEAGNFGIRDRNGVLDRGDES